jgi:RNA polymerase sigma-54 factor
VKLGLQQSMRTDLQLRLSPQMLQRIEVLQLTTLDLAQLIEQELQENETLELEQDQPEVEDAKDEPEVAAEEDWEEAEDDWERPEAGEGPSRMDVMAATAAAPISLEEHLHAQIDVLELPERDRVLAKALIGALNERGWLDVPLEEVETGLQPPPTEGEREHALHLVQALEPPGVGARDLGECLLLQLLPDRPDYDLLVSLIVNHLDDIAHNRIPRICRETGEPVERVLAAIEVISHLDPIPGRRFGSTAVPHVKPDVVVRQVGEGFEISIENDWIPSLTISRRWMQLVRDRGADPELRKHIRGKIESAQSLIEAIEQRKNTLFRVASELVNRQADYLVHGPSGLRPLRMQEVADALGVHVSTVSRAISGKYMQTPRGIVPMKALFTGEVPSREGSAGAGEETASRAGVQELVRQIIAGEDKTDPLSDEVIVTILKEKHQLDIARRTVTKYRKALRLGSSRARRVYGTT